MKATRRPPPPRPAAGNIRPLEVSTRFLPRLLWTRKWFDGGRKEFTAPELESNCFLGLEPRLAPHPTNANGVTNSELVSCLFEPSQPQRIMSGLKANFSVERHKESGSTVTLRLGLMIRLGAL